jgi:phenylalanyl-tRNA synthetase alpha chain
MHKLNINIETKESEAAKSLLGHRTDAEAERMKRFLAMPDLSRTSGSPLSELIGSILKIPRFSEFDQIKVPEVVQADISFDLFNFPPNHPARSKSDTYFIDDNNILRTHTTIMWYYYLNEKSVKEKIKNKMPVGSICHGKVYRKDEIDRNHMNVFHQVDGWYLCPKKDKIIGIEDLKEVLSEIAKAIFGSKIEYRFNQDTFPYTDPSLEMEVKVGDRWVEVLGAGVVRSIVLNNLGVDPEEYNGWAFGFGLERLAIISMELPDIRLLWSDDSRVKKQLKLGNKFKEVSKFPPITRDISFVVNKEFIPNNYFDLIRDLGGDLVEQVELLDRYENPKKFGPDKISYTYRIVYRSNERTLTTDEIDPIQENIYKQTASQFNAELR